VKYTFDVVREAPDPHTVVFQLKRPQPSLVLLLASGYSPVYAAHVGR
jgi:ABC-type oligopeptide transport system substrate-binding subunit